MEEIKEIVNNIIHVLEEKKKQQSKDIHAVWKGSVKEKEARHTRVEGIKNETLFVNVDCSAWMFQCRLRYKTILQALQKEFPEIKKIYFKIGKVL